MSEINDYLSKADKDLAKSVMYRVYGMPGPLFMNENEGGDTPEPEPEPVIDYSIPFYVENITEETETLTIVCYEDTMNITIQKSDDATNWSTLGTVGTEDCSELTMDILPGNKIYLRSNTNAWGDHIDDEGTPVGCTISGVSKVGGNIMSLIYGDTFTGNEVSFPDNTTLNFGSLFSGSALIDASELILPVTTLTESCYRYMFYNTLLTSAPQLPATTLARDCYDSMFNGCTALTTAPTLPATTLAELCYNNMFNGCTALTTAPELPATTLTEGCYQSMFNGCSSLTTAPTLPATTLADSCYPYMFQSCSSLTTAPTLPATTLADGCYGGMFSGCTSLNEITIYANDISAGYCLYDWLDGVAETGTFHNLGTATYETGRSGIPSGWTEVNN